MIPEGPGARSNGSTAGGGVSLAAANDACGRSRAALTQGLSAKKCRKFRSVFAHPGMAIEPPPGTTFGGAIDTKSADGNGSRPLGA